MGIFNENMTWFLFVYFGQLLSGLSLIVGFFKNFGTVIVLSHTYRPNKQVSCLSPSPIAGGVGLNRLQKR